MIDDFDSPEFLDAGRISPRDDLDARVLDMEWQSPDGKAWLEKERKVTWPPGIVFGPPAKVSPGFCKECGFSLAVHDPFGGPCPGETEARERWGR